MSRKTYQMIALAIHAQRQLDGKLANADSILSCLSDRIADMFAADNHRFDRARFIEACETGDCKGMR